MLPAVVQEVDAEELHVALYPSRLSIWTYLKTHERLKPSLQFLSLQFRLLLHSHCTGKERFARFLVSWYRVTSTLACESLSTAETRSLGHTQISDYPGAVSTLDRSSLVSAIATAAYKFLQKQVRMHLVGIN